MPKNTLSKGEAKAIQFFGKYFGGLQTRVYRATGGKIGGRFMGAPVLLLTTTGRKSGLPRTSPLIYLREGERYFVVGSKGGFPTHPDWYLNLQAQPTVQVQIDSRVLAMTARTISEEEKARVWPKLVEIYRGYQAYQERTERSIPVIALEQTPS